MSDQIGKLAGQVWRFLGEQGEVDVAMLSRKMKVKPARAYQGLGWLAREGKVVYSTTGEKTFVSLSKGEQCAFDAHVEPPGA